jgi:hypothetical protein
MNPFYYFLLYFLFHSLSFGAPKSFPGTYTSSKDSKIPMDFKFQGEYKSKNYGAQVISLDQGNFQGVLYAGGLPGQSWDGKSRSLLHGQLKDHSVVLKPATGKRKYLAGPADEFSATQKFPPVGHQPYYGSIAENKLTLKNKEGQSIVLQKVYRASSSLGKKAPSGSLVLFDGTNIKEWQGGRLDNKTKFLNTDGSDIRTKRKFNNYHLHLEFMLPFRPAARGQGRGNSGLYQVDMYENQILDSFGLEGKNNECGGIYSIKDSIVNACLPPLTWQTYDIEFTNAKSNNGKKTKNARISAKLNGFLIHDNFEIPAKTGGARADKEGTPGPIKLQGHGNPLQFKNIWIIQK